MSALELIAGTILATIVVPFLIGYWIGHAEAAAVAFGALGVTILFRQASIPVPDAFAGKLIAGILISTALSATSAYYGGRARTRVVRPMSD